MIFFHVYIRKCTCVKAVCYHDLLYCICADVHSMLTAEQKYVYILTRCDLLSNICLFQLANVYAHALLENTCSGVDTIV